MDNAKRYIPIIARAFAQNKSVLFSIGMARSPQRSIERLVKYAWKIAQRNGFILTSSNQSGAAIVSYSEQKLPFLLQWYYDIELVLGCLGIFHARKVLIRNKALKACYPPGPKLYLWFIGIEPNQKQRGTGSELIQQLIERGRREQLPIYLETSMSENDAFYQKHGFECYLRRKLPGCDFETAFYRKLPQ